MKSEYYIDLDQYIKENHIQDDISEYVKNEISGADLFFMYFIYNILQ